MNPRNKVNMYTRLLRQARADLRQAANESGGRDTWDEDPNYPVADWQYDVSNDDTRLGYWEWVDAQLEYGD